MTWVRSLPNGTWVPTEAQCLGEAPADTPDPVVTPDLVLEAVRRIGLPTVQVRVQPEAATLVNFDTIFYTTRPTFERTVTLLGSRVDVRAEATSYRWNFGDGHSLTTDTPGRPYPAKDITHAYTDAHVTENPSVDVTYTVEFRVDSGAWRSIPDTITVNGPTVDLRIREATPVLAGG